MHSALRDYCMASLKSLHLLEGVEDIYSDIPVELVTGTGVDPRPRLRVDAAQTSFFEGREFRSYIELNIPAGSTTVVRFTAPQDFILHNQTLMLDDGFVRMSAATGGAEGGSWSALPVIGKNRMASRPTPLYAAVCSLSTGGTHTGGTEVEVIRLKTSGATGQAQSVGAVSAERGLPAGVYYIRFQNLGSGATTGVYSLFWEEVQPRSSVIR